MQALLDLLPPHPSGKGKLVKRLATHHFPHLDEVGALVLLEHRGEVVFPGIEKLIKMALDDGGKTKGRKDPDLIQFWGTAQETPDSRPIEAHLHEGTLPIGIAKGPVDEHQSGFRHECATSLMAGILGIKDDPVFTRMLGYIQWEDRNGDRNPLGPSAMGKGTGRQFGSLAAIRIGRFLLTTHLGQRESFMTQVVSKYRELASKVAEIPGPMVKKRTKGEDQWVRLMYRLVVIELPEPMPRGDQLSPLAQLAAQMPSAAMSKYGDEADIVVMRWQGGQTQIFYRRNRHIDFDSVVRAIRYYEIAARIRTGKMTQATFQDWQDLSAEGTIDDAPAWHYPKKEITVRRGKGPIVITIGINLLNGSLSHPEVEPTLLTTQEIVAAITLALDETKWHRGQEQCATGRMCRLPDQSGGTCPMYWLGLPRCCAVRRQVKISQRRDQHHDDRPRTRPQRQDHKGGNGRSHHNERSQAAPARDAGSLRARMEEIASAHKARR
ncbi:MAG: hypothetical protein WC675_04520 [Patescibacteria group bacterium]|jgi:hypothetical protein